MPFDKFGISASTSRIGDRTVSLLFKCPTRDRADALAERIQEIIRSGELLDRIAGE